MNRQATFAQRKRGLGQGKKEKTTDIAVPAMPPHREVP